MLFKPNNPQLRGVLLFRPVGVIHEDCKYMIYRWKHCLPIVDCHTFDCRIIVDCRPIWRW